jgi:hypothetical protein
MAQDSVAKVTPLPGSGCATAAITDDGGRITLIREDDLIARRPRSRSPYLIRDGVSHEKRRLHIHVRLSLPRVISLWKQVIAKPITSLKNSLDWLEGTAGAA